MSLEFRSKDVVERETRVLRVAMPPQAFSVLTQVRRTMDIQDDLVPSILEHGQQTPGVAAALTKKEAVAYLDQINAIYRKRHTLRDIKRVLLDRRAYYLVLVAGHRRHQTCLWINHAVEKGDSVTYSQKYQGLYRAELRFGLVAKEAIALQFNENRHAQVPPHEEARAAWDFWRWLRIEDSSLTVAHFARMIGRNSGWVRNALRFCALPDSVQRYVDGQDGLPTIPYGVLIEVARLADSYKSLTGEDLSEEAHHLWVRKAVLGRLDATKFGRAVSEYLSSKKDEQRGQFSLFGSIADEEDKRPVRRVVAPDLVRLLWTYIEYWKSLEAIRKSGGFGTESYIGPEHDSVARQSYSPGSPIHLLASHITIMEGLVPHLAELAKNEGGRHRRKLKRGEVVLTEALTSVQTLLQAEQSSKN